MDRFILLAGWRVVSSHPTLDEANEAANDWIAKARKRQPWETWTVRVAEVVTVTIDEPHTKTP
jgi:hypothetical protein